MLIPLGHHGRSPMYGPRFRLPPMGLIPSLVAGGSTDPNTNAALATVLRAAKSSGVPRSNIENALKKVRDPMRAWLVHSRVNTSLRRAETRIKPRSWQFTKPWSLVRSALSCTISRLRGPRILCLTSIAFSECLTDNSNRTVHKLRELLTSHK